MGYLACPVCECITLSDVQDLQLKVARSLTRPLSCPICSLEVPGIHSLHQHLATHIPLEWNHQNTTTSPSETVPALASLDLQDVSSPSSEVHGTEKTQFNCKYCGLVFSSEHFLNIHQDIIHAQSAHLNLTCKICKVKLSSLEEHRDHLRKVHGEDRYFCERCPKSFKMKGGLLVHNRMYHDTNAAHCKVCKKQFSSKVRKEIHEKKHHRKPDSPAFPQNNPKTPPAPEKSLVLADTSPKDNPAPMEKPLEIMLPAMPTQFSYPDKTTASHIMTTPQINPVISQNAFNTNLMNGMNFTLVLPPQNPPEQNVVWNNPSYSSAPLVTDSIQFQAALVNPVVNPQNSVVEAPMALHESKETDALTKVKSPKKKEENSKGSDSKQWECDVCKKSFTTKYFLKKHKRLHTGETPYSCEKCGKTFTFQQSYHKHIFYHTDEKPHVCSHCGRSFKELSTLQNHIRTHTGEKPFKCATCGRAFRQRVSYLVHQRIHNGIMPYKCDDCGKTFRYKVSMRSHKCEGRTQENGRIASSQPTVPNTRLLSVLEALSTSTVPFEVPQENFGQAPNDIPIQQTISQDARTDQNMAETLDPSTALNPMDLISPNDPLTPNIETDLFLQSLFE